MSSARLAADFVEYSREKLLRQLWPRLRDVVGQLTPEQVWWRADESNNSVGNLLLHLNGNVRQWIVAGVGGAHDRRNRDSEFAQRVAIAPQLLLDRLNQTLGEAEAAIASLQPEQLIERRTIQGHDVSVLQAVYHVVEHFSMHVGQIIFINKMLLKRDLGFYAYLKGQDAAAGKKP